jgi:hypothetical protein
VVATQADQTGRLTAQQQAEPEQSRTRFDLGISIATEESSSRLFLIRLLLPLLGIKEIHRGTTAPKGGDHTGVAADNCYWRVQYLLIFTVIGELIMCGCTRMEQRSCTSTMAVHLIVGML